MSNDVYHQCYSIYKQEYTNDKEFSIKSEDISEELDGILNEYEVNLKKRNDNLSNSIYSDILDIFGIKFNYY